MYEKQTSQNIAPRVVVNKNKLFSSDKINIIIIIIMHTSRVYVMLIQAKERV